MTLISPISMSGTPVAVLHSAKLAPSKAALVFGQNRPSARRIVTNKVIGKLDDGSPQFEERDYPIVYRRKQIAKAANWTHRATGEPVPISIERMKTWAANTNKLIAAGVNPYLPDRHRWDITDADADEPLSAGHNFGKVLSLAVDGDSLYADYMLVGEQAQIAEAANDVSICIMDGMLDAKGGKHGEALQHLAIVHNPALPNLAPSVRIAASADVPEHDVAVVVLEMAGEAEPRHSYSNVHVNLPPELSAKVLAMAHEIPDEDLAEDGRSGEPHVTCLYGLHTSDPKDAAAAIAGEGPVSFKLGKASVFPATDDRPSDVVKLDIDSPDLHRINGKLRTLPHTNKFSDYTPHATLAYVKPGKGAEHAKRFNELAGSEAEMDRVRFSDRDGMVTDIPLAKPAAPAVRRPSRLALSLASEALGLPIRSRLLLALAASKPHKHRRDPEIGEGMEAGKVGGPSLDHDGRLCLSSDSTGAKDPAGHWVTLDNGVHIFIGGSTGRIEKGPSVMVGKKPSEIDPKHTEAYRNKPHDHDPKLSGNGEEHYQWMRKSADGQKHGNQQSTLPLTKENYEKHVQAHTKGQMSFEQYKSAHPEATHASIVREGGEGDWKLRGTGSADELRPRGHAVKAGWVQQVHNHQSEVAQEIGKMSDKDWEPIRQRLEKAVAEHGAKPSPARVTPESAKAEREGAASAIQSRIDSLKQKAGLKPTGDKSEPAKPATTEPAKPAQSAPAAKAPASVDDVLSGLEKNPEALVRAMRAFPNKEGTGIDAKKLMKAVASGDFNIGEAKPTAKPQAKEAPAAQPVAKSDAKTVANNTDTVGRTPAKPTTRAKGNSRLTKDELESTLRDFNKERGATWGPEHDAELEATNAGGDPWTFRDKIPTDVKEEAAGRGIPATAFRVGQNGGGADAYSALGDRYMQLAELRHGGSSMQSALGTAKDAGDRPDMQFLARVHESMGNRNHGDVDPLQKINPQSLNHGDTFNINGKPHTVEEHDASGDLMIHDEHGNATPVDQLKYVPHDKGSYISGKPADYHHERAGAIPFSAELGIVPRSRLLLTLAGEPLPRAIGVTPRSRLLLALAATLFDKGSNSGASGSQQHFGDGGYFRVVEGRTVHFTGTPGHGKMDAASAAKLKGHNEAEHPRTHGGKWAQKPTHEYNPATGKHEPIAEPQSPHGEVKPDAPRVPNLVHKSSPPVVEAEKPKAHLAVEHQKRVLAEQEREKATTPQERQAVADKFGDALAAKVKLQEQRKAEAKAKMEAVKPNEGADRTTPPKEEAPQRSGGEEKHPWEMSKKDFYRKYSHQHTLIADDSEATQRSLESEGFRRGIGPNVAAITQGPPTDIMAQRYGTKSGKRAYAIPEKAIRDTENGAQVKVGHKPRSSESFVPARNHEPAHEALVREAVARGDKVPEHVLADYPHLKPSSNEAAPAASGGTAAPVNPHKDLFGGDRPISQHEGIFGEGTTKPAPKVEEPAKEKPVGSANANDPKHTSPLPFEEKKPPTNADKEIAAAKNRLQNDRDRRNYNAIKERSGQEAADKFKADIAKQRADFDAQIAAKEAAKASAVTPHPASAPTGLNPGETPREAANRHREEIRAANPKISSQEAWVQANRKVAATMMGGAPGSNLAAWQEHAKHATDAELSDYAKGGSGTGMGSTPAEHRESAVLAAKAEQAARMSGASTAPKNEYRARPMAPHQANAGASHEVLDSAGKPMGRFPTAESAAEGLKQRIAARRDDLENVGDILRQSGHKRHTEGLDEGFSVKPHREGVVVSHHSGNPTTAGLKHNDIERTLRKSGFDVRQDPAQGVVVKGAAKAAPQKIGSGNTGDVHRIGDEAVKSANGRDGLLTNEADVYDKLRGVEGVAAGRRVKDKIHTPFFEHVASIDSVPESRRASLGPVIAKNVPRLLNAVNALSEHGYSYNDPLQVGFDADHKSHLFDFSNAAKSKTATRDNLGALQGYLSAFGLKDEAKRISTTKDVLHHANTPDSGFGPFYADDDVKAHHESMKKNLAGYQANHAYYAKNARHVGIGGIVQSEHHNGMKAILSDKPLSDEQVKQWELTPVVHPSSREGNSVAAPAVPAKPAAAPKYADPEMQSVHAALVAAGHKPHNPGKTHRTSVGMGGTHVTTVGDSPGFSLKRSHLGMIQVEHRGEGAKEKHEQYAKSLSDAGLNASHNYDEDPAYPADEVLVYKKKSGGVKLSASMPFARSRLLLMLSGAQSPFGVYPRSRLLKHLATA